MGLPSERGHEALGALVELEVDHYRILQPAPLEADGVRGEDL